MKLIINIKGLLPIVESDVKFVAGKGMCEVKTIENAYLLIEDGKIADFGKMDDKPEMSIDVIDVSGRYVLPAFCDSHTHIVYAGSREQEWIDKIRGLEYEEIYRRGGGILNSVECLRNTGEQELFDSATERLQIAMQYGTGAMEIKSGYGLSLESELKMLRVISRLKETSPVAIKATFLGAHAVPREFAGRQDEYVDYLIKEMLPAVAAERLADFIDVFCDKGFFTVGQTERILEAAAKYGLRPKIHANELDISGGVQVGVKCNALSVDHLERIGDEEILALKSSYGVCAGASACGTMPTVLPGAAFFLNLPLSPVRAMIDSGLPVALASDCNPGSSPSPNMQLVASMGCIRYNMLPEEVLYATTLNTAYAMGISDTHGSITKGKAANLIITKPMSSFNYFAYSYGENKVERLIL
ncbi:MAG: imidazolonepropionase [Bacteroidales bacterium]|jgi:imidazolonepropionase|nr:imidazolonepropionase [Bacteroidales bacterium]